MVELRRVSRGIRCRIGGEGDRRILKATWLYIRCQIRSSPYPKIAAGESMDPCLLFTDTVFSL